VLDAVQICFNKHVPTRPTLMDVVQFLPVFQLYKKTVGMIELHYVNLLIQKLISKIFAGVKIVLDVVVRRRRISVLKMI